MRRGTLLLRLLAGIGKRLNKLLVVKGLDNEVGGTVFQSRYGQFNIGIRSKEHNSGLRLRPLDLTQPIQSLVAIVDTTMEVHVKQHHIGLIFPYPREQSRRAGHADNMLEGMLHHHLHRREDVAVVIHDKQCTVFHFATYFRLRIFQYGISIDA